METKIKWNRQFYKELISVNLSKIFNEQMALIDPWLTVKWFWKNKAPV